MKIGNVILAIFLWLMIPVIFTLTLIGMMPAFMLGGTSSSAATFCLFFPSILLFIIGLLVLISGMEKTKPIPRQRVVTEVHHVYEPKQQEIKIQNVEKKEINNINDKKEQINFCYSCGNKIEGTPIHCYICGAKLR